MKRVPERMGESPKFGDLGILVCVVLWLGVWVEERKILVKSVEVRETWREGWERGGD